MTHDGRNDGELRIRRGRRAHRIAPGGRVATVAAVATLAIVLSGCGGGAVKAKATPQTKAAPTATTEPYGVMAPNPNAEADPAVTPMGNPAWAALVKTYESLSTAEFEALPQAQRLKVVWETDYEIATKGYLVEFLDSKVSTGKILAQSNPALNPVGPDTNGQDIVDQNNFQSQVAMAMKPDITVTGNGSLDKQAAAKMLSGVTDQVGLKDKSGDYNAANTGINGTDHAAKFNTDMSSYRALQTSTLIDGKDPDGNPIQYKLVVVNASTGHTVIDQFNLVSVIDGNGTPQKMYLKANETPGSTLPANIPQS